MFRTNRIPDGGDFTAHLLGSLYLRLVTVYDMRAARLHVQASRLGSAPQSVRSSKGEAPDVPHVACEVEATELVRALQPSSGSGVPEPGERSFPGGSGETYPRKPPPTMRRADALAWKVELMFENRKPNDALGLTIDPETA